MEPVKSIIDRVRLPLYNALIERNISLHSDTVSIPSLIEYEMMIQKLHRFDINFRSYHIPTVHIYHSAHKSLDIIAVQDLPCDLLDIFYRLDSDLEILNKERTKML